MKTGIGIRYRFYKKPMTSQINMLKTSAMMEKTKVQKEVEKHFS